MKLRMRKTAGMVIACFILIGLMMGGAWAKPVVTEWEIPSLNFRSGPMAPFGRILEWANEVALEEINANGGPQGIPMVIKYYDTALDPAKAVAEMSKVVGSALVIHGPQAAHEAKATYPLVVRNKVLGVSPLCGYDISIKFKPWQLHLVGPFDEIVPPPMQEWAKRNPDMKRVVQFVWPNDPTWMETAKVQRKGLEEIGVEVLPDVECSESIDMGSAVIKAMALKPDGYVITVGPAEAGKIMVELDNRGVKERRKIMIFVTASAPPLFEIAGDKLDGAYHYSAINLEAKKPRFQEIAKRFMEHFKMDEIFFGVPFSYDALLLTGEALDKTGVTGDPKKLAEERIKIRDFMRNYKGFNGLAETYDIVDGIAKAPTYLYRFRGHKKVLLNSFFPK